VETHFSRLPNAPFQARQNEDGTWDIMDVPVFSIVPEGVKGAPRDITEDDLRTSIEVHRRKHADDQFLARTNAGHNSPFQKAEPAGFFLPKSVKSIRFDGSDRPVLFVDLISVPQCVVDRIDAHELPYRSVEVREWEPLQFGALALLDTHDPFFQLPMMTSLDRTETVSTSVDVTHFRDEQVPAVAAFVSQSGSRFLFRFGDDMPEDEKKNDETEAKLEDGGDLKSAISAIEAKMKEFAPLLELLPKLQEMLAGPEGEAEEQTEEPPVEFEDEEKDDEKPAFDAATAARISALEDKQAARDRADTVKENFSATVSKLEGDGYHLTDASRARIKQAAEQGEKTLALFEASYREVAPTDPPFSLEGDFRSTETAWPAEVMAYQPQGPEMFEAAKREHGEHQKMIAMFSAAEISSLEEHLKREVG